MTGTLSRVRQKGAPMLNATNDPGYLTGWLGPVRDEIDASDLRIDGALPPELDGRYLRNGSNPLPGTDPGHNFAGQGMVHGVRLSAGAASWYRNRWVKTPTMSGANPVNPDGTWNLRASLANTSILPYNGHIYALEETGFPYEITPDLGTVGPYDFCGALHTAMTAHPKHDPAAGELLFFGYSLRPPFVTYHVASDDGRLLHSEPIAIGAPQMMHDFAITEHYVVWFDQPVLFDRARAGRGGMPFGWNDEYPTRIGIMPRSGVNADIRWVRVAPHYIFHSANAYEDEDERIVLEGIAYDRTSFNTIWGLLGSPTEHDAAPVTGSVLYRWVLDPAKGTVSEGPLDELPIEFPAINYAYLGRRNRYSYAVNQRLGTSESSGKVVKYDRNSGRRDIYDLGPDWIPGEPTFVGARDATAEDDGYLMYIATHATADAALLFVHGAANLGAAPVAIVHLPRRVPAGFHGRWIPEHSPDSHRLHLPLCADERRT